MHIFDSKMVQNLWKQPWIRVTTCFFVVSNHLGKHKTIFQNWEKNDEVGLTPSTRSTCFLGEPTFCKIGNATEKVRFNIFLPNFFCIDTWTRMLFPISNNRYMDLCRNKWVINGKWAKSECQKHGFWYSE